MAVTSVRRGRGGPRVMAGTSPVTAFRRPPAPLRSRIRVRSVPAAVAATRSSIWPALVAPSRPPPTLQRLRRHGSAGRPAAKAELLPLPPWPPAARHWDAKP